MNWLSLIASRITLYALSALIVGGLFFYQHTTIKSLRAEKDALALDLAASNALLELRDKIDRARDEALNKLREGEHERERERRDLRDSALAAESGNDGRVAGVLRVAIDGLRPNPDDQ